MAELVKVHQPESPGRESFEFRLAAGEQELILKEVDGSPHVLEWVRQPQVGGAFLLRTDQVTELYEAIESVAYMYSKSAQTQKALQALVKTLEDMVRGYYQEKFAVDGVVDIGPGEECKLAEFGLCLEDLEKLVPANVPVRMGPNQPCRCGSGKKHQKCCGRTG